MNELTTGINILQGTMKLSTVICWDGVCCRWFEAAGDGSVWMWATLLDVLILHPEQDQWENQDRFG